MPVFVGMGVVVRSAVVRVLDTRAATYAGRVAGAGAGLRMGGDELDAHGDT